MTRQFIYWLIFKYFFFHIFFAYCERKKIWKLLPIYLSTITLFYERKIISLHNPLEGLNYVYSIENSLKYYFIILCMHSILLCLKWQKIVINDSCTLYTLQIVNLNLLKYLYLLSDEFSTEDFYVSWFSKKSSKSSEQF